MVILQKESERLWLLNSKHDYRELLKTRLKFLKIGTLIARNSCIVTGQLAQPEEIEVTGF